MDAWNIDDPPEGSGTPLGVRMCNSAIPSIISNEAHSRLTGFQQSYVERPRNQERQYSHSEQSQDNFLSLPRSVPSQKYANLPLTNCYSGCYWSAENVFTPHSGYNGLILAKNYETESINAAKRCYEETFSGKSSNLTSHVAKEVVNSELNFHAGLEQSYLYNLLTRPTEFAKHYHKQSQQHLWNAKLCPKRLTDPSLTMQNRVVSKNTFSKSTSENSPSPTVPQFLPPPEWQNNTFSNFKNDLPSQKQALNFQKNYYKSGVEEYFNKYSLLQGEKALLDGEINGPFVKSLNNIPVSIMNADREVSDAKLTASKCTCIKGHMHQYASEVGFKKKTSLDPLALSGDVSNSYSIINEDDGEEDCSFGALVIDTGYDPRNSPNMDEHSIYDVNSSVARR